MSRVRASRPVALGMVVLLGAAALVGCSSGGSEDAETTTTTTPASSTTATEPAPSEPADTTTTSAAGGSGDAPGEVETVDLLEFLLEEDESIGARFDWNTGAGVIAIQYLGVQKVQLFTAAALDVDSAVAACELAGEHVFAVDEGASIEVLTGTYPDGTVIAAVQGPDGRCAAP